MKTITGIIGKLLVVAGFLMGAGLMSLVGAFMESSGYPASQIPNFTLFVIGFGSTLIPAIIFLSINKILGKLQEIDEDTGLIYSVLNQINDKITNLESAPVSTVPSEPTAAPKTPTYNSYSKANSWICKGCGVVNTNSARYCKGCEEAKS